MTLYVATSSKNFCVFILYTHSPHATLSQVHMCVHTLTHRGMYIHQERGIIYVHAHMQTCTGAHTLTCLLRFLYKSFYKCLYHVTFSSAWLGKVHGLPCCSVLCTWVVPDVAEHTCLSKNAQPWGIAADSLSCWELHCSSASNVIMWTWSSTWVWELSLSMFCNKLFKWAEEELIG